MTTPMFSVVIPLYNKATHIADTIQSVLAQDERDFEIIVVDDGSIDDGPAIVERMQQQSAQIRLVRQANGGVSRARNTGISEASGRYLCFLDGDDLWHSTFLSEMRRLIAAYPEAGAYSCAYAHQFANGQQIAVEPRFSRDQRKQTHFLYDLFAVASRGELPIMPSSCCIPRHVLEQCGGFPEGEPIGEDQDLWIRIAYHYPMAYSRQVYCYYLQDAENRACLNNIPSAECPFSRRLQQHALQSNDPRRRDMLRMTANHLLHLAQLNILAGNRDAARQLLAEPRCWLLPKRLLKWRLKLQLG